MKGKNENGPGSFLQIVEMIYCGQALQIGYNVYYIIIHGYNDVTFITNRFLWFRRFFTSKFDYTIIESMYLPLNRGSVLSV